MGFKIPVVKKGSFLFAVIALLLNAFVVAGLGSVMAGRIREGVMQLGMMILSVIVIAIGAYFFISFLLPLSLVWIVASLGIGLGIAGWVWGIVTGVNLIKEYAA